MQIRIQDYNGCTQRIDSENIHVVAAWFADQTKTLMSANSTMMPLQMYICPQTDHERRILSGPDRLMQQEADFSSRGLLALAEAMTAAAGRAKQLEEARNEHRH